jgi:hypothetical protein
MLSYSTTSLKSLKNSTMAKIIFFIFLLIPGCSKRKCSKAEFINITFYSDVGDGNIYSFILSDSSTTEFINNKKFFSRRITWISCDSYQIEEAIAPDTLPTDYPATVLISKLKLKGDTLYFNSTATYDKLKTMSLKAYKKN